MSDNRERALQYAREHQKQFLDELKDFASIPSISTDPEAVADVQRAAEWVAGQLKALNVAHVQIFPTAKHPVVYGEILDAGPQAPTALLYGHYDVQPAEPLELWESAAFEPSVRGENLYGRGVSDMKGQVMVLLKSIEAIIRTGSKMPINVKFLIEGEEEIGSPSLKTFITEHKELLACDFAINPDTGMISAEVPTITYALRGMAYFEILLTGPANDLHSGTFGGIVHNPGQVLCDLIAGMHDQEGRITLPGFYDRVRPLDDEERAELARLPLSDDYFIKQAGVSALWRGEEGYTAIERVGARPTLEVNGLLSGYTGAGAKTVLPAKAMAKISCRLVPDQHPQEIRQALERYLETHAPATITWEVQELVGGPASISDRHSQPVQALSKAFEQTWGTRPVFKREGGSVPVVNQFQELLKIESVNTGFGLMSDNAHGPNEKLHLPTWYRGLDTFIHYFFNLAESK